MLRTRPTEEGQALLLIVGILAAVLLGSLVLGSVARAIGVRGDRQRAADLRALAAAPGVRGGGGAGVARCVPARVRARSDPWPAEPRPPRARGVPRDRPAPRDGDRKP